MRTCTNSDIYRDTLNKGNVYSTRLLKILTGQAPGTVILNDKLDSALNGMKRSFKDAATLQVINAIANHKIVLMITSQESNLPICLPFVKYTSEGVTKELVNLTDYITSKVDEASGENDYDIDVRKLHAITLAAYIDLTLCSEKAVLPSDALNSAAVIWARMFNKILEGSIGLGTNRDRYNAFMYLAIKFFLVYYMDTPLTITENIAMNYIDGEKNSMLQFIEENIAAKGVNMYESFGGFCHMLFDNEITNMKGIKLQNVSDSMNQLFYQRKFVDMYYYPALLTLASFPYFLYTVICTNDQSGIVNFKVLKKIIEEDKLDSKLMISLYKELR